MAYFSQEMKAARVPELKKIMKKYGMKATYGIYDNSVFVINIKSGKLDIIGNAREVARKRNRDELCYYSDDYLQVNTYWIEDNFSDEVSEFLTEVNDAANRGNYDNSEPQIDYFCRGWYVNINVGKWNKPYIVE